jgi:hypothetical protein
MPLALLETSHKHASSAQVWDDETLVSERPIQLSETFVPPAEVGPWRWTLAVSGLVLAVCILTLLIRLF